MFTFLSTIISNKNIISLLTAGLMCSIGLPLLFVLLRRRFHLNVIPFLIGATGYMILVLLAETQLRTWIIDPDSPLYDIMVANPALYMLAIGFGSALLIEGGKFLIFYFMKRWYSSHYTAIAFSLGFCAVNTLFLVGIRYIIYSWLAHSQNMNIMSGAASLDYPELFRTLASQTPIDIFLVGIERYLYCAITIGLTFLVWYSATKPFKMYLLYAAVLLHAIFYAPYALTEVHVLEISTPYYIIVTVIAVLSLFIAYLVYRAAMRSRNNEADPFALL
jgi:uncharacterized membrane protein YhfC